CGIADRTLTRVIFAVADDNEDATPVFGLFCQLLADRQIYGIEQRRPAARPDLAKSICQRFRIVRKILSEIDPRIEADNQTSVLVSMHYGVKEIDCRVLFRFEPDTGAAAGIDQHCNAQG